MLRLSKKEGFKLVIEATEWRNPKDYFGFITRIINIEKDLQKKYLDRKVINTIAISSVILFLLKLVMTLVVDTS